MRKILDNSGNTDVKFITYKQGANKPELVSIESSETTQNPEVYKKEARDEMLNALKDFIDDALECYVEQESNYYTLEKVYKLIYRGSAREFIEDFEEYLKKCKGLT